jgi:hypothetical protein
MTKNKEVLDYLEQLPEDRKVAMSTLFSIIQKNLSKDFQETISYGMITFCIPHSKYPAGYHCNPKQALPFLSIASQKNFIAVYHMGMYADPELLNWFTEAYTKSDAGKLDMGKSCVRFKKMDKIPFKLIGELAKKMTADQWISCYEKNYVKKAKG